MTRHISLLSPARPSCGDPQALGALGARLSAPAALCRLKLGVMFLLKSLQPQSQSRMLRSLVAEQLQGPPVLTAKGLYFRQGTSLRGLQA